MKFVILLLTLVATVSSATGIEDRELLDTVNGVNIYGVTHTENFELACEVESLEDGKWAKGRMWIDQDFNLSNSKAPAAENYRVAYGLPSKNAIVGIVGIELPVQSLAMGRCLKYCTSIEVLTLDEKDPTKTALLQVEEVGSNSYSITSFDKNGTVEIKGSCQANEVP
jgi:hypothetical protein